MVVVDQLGKKLFKKRDGGDAAPASRVPKPLALSSIEEIV